MHSQTLLLKQELVILSTFTALNVIILSNFLTAHNSEIIADKNMAGFGAQTDLDIG